MALAAFLCGAGAGGRIGARFGDRRFAHLRAANSVTVVLLAAATVLAAIIGQPLSSWQRHALVGAIALAMGVQNAMARSLAVPDLTTTVLTQMLTGVAADSTAKTGSAGHVGRRLIAVCAMIGGALIGALLGDPRRHHAAAGGRGRPAGGDPRGRAVPGPVTGPVRG